MTMTGTTKSLELKPYLDTLNNEVSSSKDEWSISCQTNRYSCDHRTGTDLTHAENYCIELSSCKTKNLGNWYTSTSDSKKIVDAFITSVQKARKVDGYTIANDNSALASTSSIETVLQILDNRYTKFLEKQTGSIDVFINTIDDLTGIFVQFSGDGGIFAMLNCLFIGRNVKVILKYLKSCLGKDIYTVGVCLLITGVAMCVSIAFTILLNIIINTADNTNEGGDGVPEIGNDGNDPNVNFNNSPQGNYETEKTPYAGNYNQNNYNNNENYTGGARIINYNN